MATEPTYAGDMNAYAGDFIVAVDRALNLEMEEKKVPFLTFQCLRPPRPLSDATEIYDTDIEDSVDTVTSSSRSRRSVSSLANSDTTISSFEEAPTPISGDLEPCDVTHKEEDRPVEGPTGPHLFRFYPDESQDLDFYLSMSPPHSPVISPVKTESSPLTQLNLGLDPDLDQGLDLDLDLDRQDAFARPLSSLNHAVAALDDAEIRGWSTRQVVNWMQSMGFEESIVEKFRMNDIDGSILIGLKFEDLKELDIPSFGKRHRLMNEIENLRSNGMISQSAPPMQMPLRQSRSPIRRPATANSAGRSRSRGYGKRERRVVPIQHQMAPMFISTINRNGGDQNDNGNGNEDVLPGESVSIVAIEQLLPKPHHCSKGERCPKYQRRRRKIERLMKEFDLDMEAATKQSPTVESVRPTSEAAPSAVASSDVFGPEQRPEFRLDAEKLKAIQTRDPQESVRQFLNLQGVEQPDRSQDVDERSETPKATRQPQDKFHTLPKLTIPLYNPRGTVSCDSTPVQADYVVEPAPHFEPEIALPADNVCRHATPFSEMDVPLTNPSINPVERDVSQSVPPDMRYGGRQQPADPIPRSTTRMSSHRRQPSVPVLRPLPENRVLSPISGPEDLEPPNYGYSHAGWMKKRRTRRLRHEWQDHHCILRGTRLELRKNECPTADCLEYIDVDDYAVACSSLSSSKLSAALRALRLSGKKSSNDIASAFTFQLVPAAEKKGLLGAVTGKTHHFAVKSRDERIDWMRELMLAKALKQRLEGFEVNVNGNMI